MAQNPVAVQTSYVREEDLEFEAVTFADSASGDTFQVQRGLVDSDDDIERGWNTYCLVRGSLTFYGGLDGLDKRGTWLEFRLADDAANILELPTVFGLTVDESEYLLVKEHLLRMLEFEDDE